LEFAKQSRGQCSDRPASFKVFSLLPGVLTLLGRHRSFNAPRKALYARLLNSITSKSFTILRVPTFRLRRAPTAFILRAQALPQTSALIGLQIVIKVWMADGASAECRWPRQAPEFAYSTLSRVSALSEIVFPTAGPSIPILNDMCTLQRQEMSLPDRLIL